MQKKNKILSALIRVRAKISKHPKWSFRLIILVSCSFFMHVIYFIIIYVCAFSDVLFGPVCNTFVVPPTPKKKKS